jgi:hypothetical protein
MMTLEYGGRLTLFEVYGRQIAEQWIDELNEWEEDLPPGRLPSDANLARLIEWSGTIVGMVTAAETATAFALAFGYPPRAEREETLEAMRDARRRACLKTRQVWELAREHEELRRAVEENNLEGRLEDALAGVGGA